MRPDDEALRVRLSRLLGGTDPHIRACRTELERGEGTAFVVTRLDASVSAELMRLRVASGPSSDLGQPDFGALSRAAGRLEFVIMFGLAYDCQLLLDPTLDAIVFCWASPTDRQHLPLKT
jgi:hypothetical protein